MRRTIGSDDPFALLLTWTTYGSWLPGDPRGHVSPSFERSAGYQRRRNTPGAPLAGHSPVSTEMARFQQRQPTVRLTKREALVVVAALCDAARQRSWSILRGAVLSNHVHLVVGDCPDNAGEVRRVFKGVSQAALSLDAGGPRRWWTTHGSDRYLHDDDSIAAAIRYVADQSRPLAAIANGEIF